jgi:hypothetical protein
MQFTARKATRNSSNTLQSIFLSFLLYCFVCTAEADHEIIEEVVMFGTRVFPNVGELVADLNLKRGFAYQWSCSYVGPGCIMSVLKNSIIVGYDDVAAVTVKNAVFWDVPLAAGILMASCVSYSSALKM